MSIFTKIKAWFAAKEDKIEEFLTPFEHDFLAKASDLARQIEAHLGQDGITLAKEALSVALSAAAGDFGAAIAAAAPKLLAEVVGDISSEAKNAVYGALAIAQAELQAAAA